MINWKKTKMKFFEITIFATLLSLAVATVPQRVRGPQKATTCDPNKCKIEDNCRCSTAGSPFPDGSGPQLIALTFDESIEVDGYTNYWKPLLYSRVNPDNEPIVATFFVPHDYTNYVLVNDIWLNGFEIGVHSISKNSDQEYWRSASLDTLVKEFEGQRKIINYFAEVPMKDIVGVRSPQLQLNGDVTIDAYKKAGLLYDNSMPTLPNKPFFPYTLDYASEQDCLASKDCPIESHPGSWVIPISDLTGVYGKECHSLVTCNITGEAEDIASWLMDEVNKVRNSSRIPITLIVESNWFEFTKNSYKGFEMFLDQAGLENDIFFVGQTQVIHWMKNPVPLSEFKTEFDDTRASDCIPTDCPPLKGPDGKTRYMKVCSTCPQKYPWLDNPLGE